MRTVARGVYAMRYLLLACLVLVGCSKPIPTLTAERTPTGQPSIRPEIVVNAQDIFLEYMKDKKACEEKYYGKTIRTKLYFSMESGDGLVLLAFVPPKIGPVTQAELQQSRKEVGSQTGLFQLKKPSQMPDLRYKDIVLVDILVDKILNGTHLIGECLRIKKTLDLPTAP